MRLVLLHALPLDGRMWEAQMSFVPERSLAPDLYNLGNSVADWAAGVLEQAGDDDLLVVGCSVGGSCALEMAASAPDRVAAVVLVGAKAAHRPEPEFRDEAVTLLRSEGMAGAWPRYWNPLFAPTSPPHVVERARRLAFAQDRDDVIRGVESVPRQARPRRRRPRVGQAARRRQRRQWPSRAAVERRCARGECSPRRVSPGAGMRPLRQPRAASGVRENPGQRDRAVVGRMTAVRITTSRGAQPLTRSSAKRRRHCANNPLVHVWNPVASRRGIGQGGGMFRSSAHVYDLAYSNKDYEAEAVGVRDLVRRHNPAAETLLDVACGTGRHLQHLRAWFDIAGVDVDPGMVAVAQQRLDGVTVEVADMRSMDLGRRFDVVTCLFSSVGYMHDVAELRQAVAVMRAHLARRGVLVVDGWVRPERWIDPGTTFSEAVRSEEVALARAGRSWRNGRHSILEIHYLVATTDGVDQLEDRHELMLFSDEEYRSAFTDAGLRVERIDSPMPDRDRYVGLAP